MNFLSVKEKMQQYCGSRAPLPKDDKRFFNYVKGIDTKDYAVYFPPYRGEEVLAAYGTTVVTQRTTKRNIIFIYPYFAQI